MAQVLHVPDHWPLVWWGSDNRLIRMACPACGAFSLALALSPAGDEIKTLECQPCGLSGFDRVQAAMNSWGTRQQQAAQADQTAHAEAAKEGDMHTAVARQRNTRRAA